MYDGHQYIYGRVIREASEMLMLQADRDKQGLEEEIGVHSPIQFLRESIRAVLAVKHALDRAANLGRGHRRLLRVGHGVIPMPPTALGT